MSGDSEAHTGIVVDRAIQRLLSAAWACACVVVVTCWCLSYGVSALLSGDSVGQFLLLSSVGSLLSMLTLFDVLNRVNQCQAMGDYAMEFSTRFVSDKNFRPLPNHLIDDADKLAGDALQSWLNSIAHELPDVLRLAEKYRDRGGVLRISDAVNLRVFADWNRRQKLAGLLQV